MRHFHYREDELFCEDVSLKEIAEKVGTPFYVYSYDALVGNLERIKKAFTPLDPLICYSLKANANLTLCRILASYGAGADVVSGGELYQALRAGFPPEKVVYSGVGKTSEEIEYALKEGILLLNVESEDELHKVVKIAEKLKIKASISLRINPDIDPQTHHYITTAKEENKFGVSLSQAEDLYQKTVQVESVEIKGIHMHIGSQIMSVDPYLEALRRLSQLIDKLREYRIKLTYLDMGGGFGISYKDEGKEFPLEKLSQLILPLIPSGMKLILEPGRYIVGPSGALVTKLIYKKIGRAKKFFIVDAGMNDLIRPSLYQAYHRIIPIKKISHPEYQKVDVVGPVCESGDFFAQERKLPLINQEELVILDAGAYGFSMSSNYNGRTKLPEVLVKEENWWLIREREDYQDLIKKQRIPEEPSLYGAETSPFTFSPNFEFWKMEGSGNDFIIMDNRGKIIKEGGELARKLCQRKTKVGADGLILIEEAEDADFTMRIFNPDGSEAEMCGNGARCAAYFAYRKKIAGKECTFQTLAGKIVARIEENKVKVKMRDPSKLKENVKLNIDGKKHSGFYIDTGVPHFVLFWTLIDEAPVKKLGSKIRFHQFFHPRGTNVDFVQVEKEKVLVRTYERGVEDETLGCGTGAVASALISHLVYELPSPIEVWMRGGRVTIWFNHQEQKFSNIFLEGEVNLVYTGYLNGGEYV